mgnify:CR=1 FL=1
MSYTVPRPYYRILHQASIDKIRNSDIDVFAGGKKVTCGGSQIALVLLFDQYWSLFITPEFFFTSINKIVPQATLKVPVDGFFSAAFVIRQLKTDRDIVMKPDIKIHIRAGKPAFDQAAV